MGEKFPSSVEKNADRQDLRDHYGLKNAPVAILEAIEENVDNGRGIHKGGFISDEDFNMVTSSPGNRTTKELRAVDSVARNSFTHDGADPVVKSNEDTFNGLSLEEARDAAIGGLTLGNSLDGEDTRMTTVVIDPSEGRGKRGILETRMFTPNGSSHPYVVESFSTYSDYDETTGGRHFEGFTASRRQASPEEAKAYQEVEHFEKNNKR